MALTKYATRLLAGALALASIGTAAAQSVPALIIGDGASVAIKSPTAYVAAGSTGTLHVTADGYVLCANVDVGAGTLPGAISFAPGRDGWSLPAAGDVRNVSYSGGTLHVNKGAASFAPASTLACQARDAQGRVLSPYSAHGDNLFRDAFDLDADALQMSYLVNWRPDADSGFSWSAPVWPLAPDDSCTWVDATTPQVAETGLCAAATGVRSIAVSSQNDARYGDRAPTMWTNTTSNNNFVYLARIDARLGPQSPNDLPNSHFVSTGPTSNADVDASYVDVAIRDAYDNTYLAPNATYCFLGALPLDKLDGDGNPRDDVCSSQHAYFTGTLDAGANNGNLYERISLTPYGDGRSQSLFLAVVRHKTGANIGSCQPAAAIAVLPNPDYSAQEAGDAFIGDDVVYAFRSPDRFAWMGCSP